MSEKIREMVGSLRELYPDAVSVRLFVNHQEFVVEPTYFTGDGIASMRSLNGEWVKT